MNNIVLGGSWEVRVNCIVADTSTTDFVTTLYLYSIFLEYYPFTVPHKLKFYKYDVLHVGVLVLMISTY